MDKYKMFKQFMHNELEISKEDIKQWVKDAVETEIKAIIKNNESLYPETISRKVVHKLTTDRGFLESVKGNVSRNISDKMSIKFK